MNYVHTINSRFMVFLVPAWVFFAHFGENLVSLRSSEVLKKFLKGTRNFLFSKSVTNPTKYLWTDWRLFTLLFLWLLLFLCLKDVLVCLQPLLQSLLFLFMWRRRLVTRFLFLLRSSAGILTGRFKVFCLSPLSSGSPSGESICGCYKYYDNLHSLLSSELS